LSAEDKGATHGVCASPIHCTANTANIEGTIVTA
jgi:hypothetical protein